MFKLLIVDDEKLIREGLATGFDWESLGFYVCGTAANGIEALKIIEKDIIRAEEISELLNQQESV